MSYNPVTKIWSGPSRPSIYNTEVSLGYLILNLLKTTPDRVIQINADNGVETTCGEMFAKSVKIIRFLTSMELKQNDVVGFVANNSENLAPLAFACLTLGLPIESLSPNEYLTGEIFMYSITKPKVVFCDAGLLEIMKPSIECKIITLIEQVEGYQFLDEIIESADKEVEDFEIPSLNISSTLAFIFSSSGSTGNIKGTCKTHSEFISNFVPTYHQSLNQGDVIFITSPLAWMTSIISLLFSTFYGVTRIILLKPLTGDAYMDIIDKYKVTIVMFFPYVFDMIVKSENFRPMTSVRTVHLSGSIITNSFIKETKKVFPNAKISGLYGSTEGGIITFSRIEKSWSSGKPSNNCQVKIVDENGNNLGPNQQGEIYFKQKFNFLGFFNEPEKTAKALKDGWVISGDLGYFDDEGNIFVVERINDMLRFGNSFPSKEVEVIINEIEGVKSSAVVGVDNVFDDIVYAFVIKDPLKSDLTEEFIEKFVESRVTDEKRIRGGVHFLDKFPLTSTGKVKKYKLKEIATEIHKSKNPNFIDQL